ncbi:MAG: hypothetical protein LBQ76_05035 [Candidatus Fibromonas sp.]|jgi:hypothetical protein|nr:hypothetical protein [Candidatus Fibromonas sp.]
MKFKIAFAFSKTERDLRLRFWKWDIWRLNSEDDSEIAKQSEKKNSSKAGFLSFKKKTEEADEQRFLFQALFYPEVESRIWLAVKRLASKAWNSFSVKFENVEVKGTLEDPFYDSIAMGMSGGCYYPDWAGENGGWSAKGEMIIKIGFFRFLFFVLGSIYEFAVLTFILWRGVRLAKKNPNGENLEGIRKWIFLNYRS